MDARGVLLAGDGGSVVTIASRDPSAFAALAVEGLARVTTTPWGVNAYPAEGLDELPDLGIGAVHLVCGEEATRSLVRGWAVAHGLVVSDVHVTEAPAPTGVRILAVSAPSTGSGKSAVTRKMARSLSRSGVRVCVIRHPLPNLLLWEGRREPHVARDAGSPRAGPIEEQEEVFPIVSAGVPVVSGLDADAIVRAAAEVAPVLVWDGGGSALPWVAAEVRVAVLDLLRPMPEAARAHVAAAHAVVLTKGESASHDRVRDVESAVRAWNADAAVYLVDMPVGVPGSQRIRGRAVVVVEDWQSLVLGGFKAGAGAVAARRFRCGVVDPRPYAVGAIRDVLASHPHIGPVLPALGRTPQELEDLRSTLRATPGEAVLWGSPAPFEGIVDDDARPVVPVFPDVMEMAGGSLQDVIRPLLPGAGPVPIRRRTT